VFTDQVLFILSRALLHAWDLLSFLCSMQHILINGILEVKSRSFAVSAIVISPLSESRLIKAFFVEVVGFT